MRSSVRAGLRWWYDDGFRKRFSITILSTEQLQHVSRL